jgi:hypothetical protein
MQRAQLHERINVIGIMTRRRFSASRPLRRRRVELGARLML